MWRLTGAHPGRQLKHPRHQENCPCDPFVGPAIQHEAGLPYIVAVHVANALVVLGYISGVILWRRAKGTGQGKP